jgi:prepilin-type processing-associated H-X9-DG protein
LLVVAIIAILAAMLLPALARAKGHAQGTSCVNNLKQLQIAWKLYADDFGDFMAPENSSWDQAVVRGLPGAWVLGNAQVDTSLTNLQAGLLFPYVNSVGVYRCPSDRALTTGSKQPRIRSYSINGGLNPSTGWFDDLPYYIVRKVSGIGLPGAAGLDVFIDEQENSILAGDFAWRAKDTATWGGMPADRHNQGGALSYADGHAIIQHWRWPKADRPHWDKVLNKADLEDYKLLNSGRPRQNEYTPSWWNSVP